MLQTFLDAGYVVAATDYEGLGTPGLHPFLVGESEGRSVLDAARAAHGLKAAAAGEQGARVRALTRRPLGVVRR